MLSVFSLITAYNRYLRMFGSIHCHKLPNSLTSLVVCFNWKPIIHKTVIKLAVRNIHFSLQNYAPFKSGWCAYSCQNASIPQFGAYAASSNLCTALVYISVKFPQIIPRFEVKFQTIPLRNKRSQRANNPEWLMQKWSMCGIHCILSFRHI